MLGGITRVSHHLVSRTTSQLSFALHRTQRLQLKTALECVCRRKRNPNEDRALKDHLQRVLAQAPLRECFLEERNISMTYARTLLSPQYATPNPFSRSWRKCRMRDTRRASVREAREKRARALKFRACSRPSYCRVSASHPVSRS